MSLITVDVELNNSPITLDLGVAAGPRGPQGPTGTGGALGAYLSAFDTTNQAIATINTPQQLLIGSVLESNSIELEAPGRIVFKEAGTYSFTFSIQITNNQNNVINRASIWLEYEGDVYPNSARHFEVPAFKNSQAGEIVATVNYVATATGEDDYVEIWWEGTSTQLSAKTIESPNGIPDAPAVILTVTQVMYTQTADVTPALQALLDDAVEAKDEAEGYALSASNDAIATAADRVQTGLDVIATAADRVQTGLDVIATAADRVQTGLDADATAADRIQTGLDATATAADRVQTGLDAIATAADRVATGLDAVATAADRVQTGLDADATAADRIQTGLDATATAADRVQTGLDVIATATDRVQTGLDADATAADRIQTGLDATATAADRVQTGLDVIATAADRVQTGLDVTATAADRVQTGLDADATAADRAQTGLDADAAALSAQQAKYYTNLVLMGF